MSPKWRHDIQVETQGPAGSLSERFHLVSTSANDGGLGRVQRCQGPTLRRDSRFELDNSCHPTRRGHEPAGDRPVHLWTGRSSSPCPPKGQGSRCRTAFPSLPFDGNSGPRLCRNAPYFASSSRAPKGRARVGAKRGAPMLERARVAKCGRVRNLLLEGPLQPEPTGTRAVQHQIDNWPSAPCERARPLHASARPKRVACFHEET